jgi:hypothetical protein
VMLQQQETEAARAALGPAAYDDHVRRGRSLPVDEILRQTAHAPVLDLPPGL